MVASSVYASSGSEFIRGFLTGFHGTDVVVGELCLDHAWVQKIELDSVRIFDDLKEKHYFTLITHAQALIQDMVIQSNECHFPDIWRIIESYNSIGFSTMLYRIFCNLVPMIKELEEASPNNLYTFGFHLARALKYIEKDDSHLPAFDPDIVSLTIEGFLIGLIPQTPTCSKSLHEFGLNFNKLLNSTIYYLNGDDSLLPAIQYEAMVIINSGYQVEVNCKAVSLLQLLFESLFTETGFIKAYMRFGMKYDEISDLVKQAEGFLKEEEYKAFGETWGKVVAKVIK